MCKRKPIEFTSGASIWVKQGKELECVTQEVIDSVIAHMAHMSQHRKDNTFSYHCKGGTLTWTKKEFGTVTKYIDIHRLV